MSVCTHLVFLVVGGGMRLWACLIGFISSPGPACGCSPAGRCGWGRRGERHQHRGPTVRLHGFACRGASSVSGCRMFPLTAGQRRWVGAGVASLEVHFVWPCMHMLTDARGQSGGRLSEHFRARPGSRPSDAIHGHAPLDASFRYPILLARWLVAPFGPLAAM